MLESVVLASAMTSLRPPSIPLVAHNPYFSIWMPADTMTERWSTHWTGRIHALQGMIKVDGRPYRLLGPSPGSVPALKQKSVVVRCTETEVNYEGPNFDVTLTFTTPALPSDLSLLSRPVTYITWQVMNRGGQDLDVQVHLDATAELAVESLSQKVEPKSIGGKGFSASALGTVEQPVLSKKGDDLRIDWGRLILGGPKGKSGPVFVDQSRAAFAGLFSGSTEWKGQREAQDQWPGLAFSTSLTVPKNGKGLASAFIAYDDVASILTFEDRKLLPYWRKDFKTFEDMLTAAVSDQEKIISQCKEFDKETAAQLVKDGGSEYADISQLAYRQAWAGHALVLGAAGEPLLYSKENYSNGCIATVDVTYPSSPLFFLSGKDAGRALLQPALDYGSSSRWKFPFAPHDLGTYPHATGQVYGGGEKTEENQMPVEESGNLLILLGAQTKLEGSADFAKKYWPALVKWADFLVEQGIDPGTQLCTDDFAGHLARNANLSIKAIVGLGAFAQVCEVAGEKALAAKYKAAAQKGVEFWLANGGPQGNTVLAFGSEGTWSQKYNLVWDELLGLNLFPKSLADAERMQSVGRQNEFGLPLDNRKSYTKLDWILWTSCLGTPSNEEFSKTVKPVWNFLQSTPNRVPMTDWYDTISAHHVGFQARTVVGGVFLRTLQKSGWKPTLQNIAQ